MTAISSADRAEAQNIIEENKTLDHLSNVDIEALEKVLGGAYEKDPELAKIASDVIYDIERYKADGDLTDDDDVNDGTLSGFTRGDREDNKSEAKHGTEAGRFKDFIKYGFERLNSKKFEDGKPDILKADYRDEVNQEWFEAVKDGDVETVERFIEEVPEGWDIDVVDEDGQSALHHAVLGTTENIGEMVETLVDRGRIDMAIQNDQGKSVLDVAKWAADFSHVLEASHGPIVSFLQQRLDEEANVAAGHDNQGRLDSLVAAGADEPSDPDSVTEEYGFTPIAEIDYYLLKTDEKVDPDDEDSANLGISGAAMKNLLEDYRERIDDGELAKDSDEAKFLRAVEAQGALDSGRPILPYSEDTGENPERKENPSTFREFGGSTDLTPADHAEILDPQAVEEAIEKGFANDTISEDYQEKIKEAEGSVEGTDEIVEELTATFSEENIGEYLDYIDELERGGHVEFAKADVASRLNTLTRLDPEAGAEAEERLLSRSMAKELEGTLADPSGLDDETVNLASKDILKIVQSLIQAPHGITGLSANANETLKMLVSPENLKKFEDFVAKLAKGMSGGVISEEMVTTAARAVGGNSDFVKGAKSLHATGALGSIAGATSFVGGIYNLTAQDGGLAESDQQRLSIAKDFIGFASFVGPYEKLGNFTADLLKTVTPGDAPVRPPLSNDVPADYVGVNDAPTNQTPDNAPRNSAAPDDASRIDPANVPLPDDVSEIDPASVPLPDDASEIDPANVPLPDDVSENSVYVDAVQNQPDDALANTPTPDDVSETSIYTDAVENQPADSKGAPKWLKDLGKTKGGPIFDGVGGVLGSVLGGLDIKKGIETGNDALIAQGSLGLTTGVLGTAAGVIGTWAAVTGAAIGAASGALLGVGLIIGVGAGIATYYAEHKKKQDASDDEGEWYKDLADDGLMQDDWGDKLEYARYSLYEYGGRHAPEDVSIYEFQNEEWEYFQDTPPEHGSSENRLDSDLHTNIG